MGGFFIIACRANESMGLRTVGGADCGRKIHWFYFGPTGLK
jgi:hypothetical protein